MLSNFNIPNKIGQHGFIEFTVARLYGSTGPINISVSSTPSGFFAAQPLPPVTETDGVKRRVPLSTIKNGIMDDNVITVTGTPISAAVGASKRDIHYSYVTPFFQPPN
jgi:hypothetical protein